jgi:hypothetical protein
VGAIDNPTLGTVGFLPDSPSKLRGCFLPIR